MDKRNNISKLRLEYKKGRLSEQAVGNDPFRFFKKWFSVVQKSSILEPNAMVLATVSKNCQPSSRVVLLKGLTNNGFCFFTNYQSRKAADLASSSKASLLFFWPELERQVRIEGLVKKISEIESRQYFNMRPRLSRIAACCSPQSSIIKDRAEIEGLFKQTLKYFEGAEVEKPKNWGGYILVPNYFEFWQGRENRLHDRICFKRLKQTSWKKFRLAP